MGKKYDISAREDEWIRDIFMINMKRHPTETSYRNSSTPRSTERGINPQKRENQPYEKYKYF